MAFSFSLFGTQVYNADLSAGWLNRMHSCATEPLESLGMTSV